MKSNSLLLAHAIVEQLAQYEITDLDAETVALLRSAAAELTSAADLPIDVAIDESPVAMVRMVTRAAAADPTAGGPHSVVLFDHLFAIDPRS